MKIGQNEPQVPAEKVSARPASMARPGATSPAAPTSTASATVALSAGAYLSNTLPTDPTFDAAKVERIAAAIRDGQFKIDAGAIADQLITNAQELLSRSAR